MMKVIGWIEADWSVSSILLLLPGLTAAHRMHTPQTWAHCTVAGRSRRWHCGCSPRLLLLLPASAASASAYGALVSLISPSSLLPGSSSSPSPVSSSSASPGVKSGSDSSSS